MKSQHLIIFFTVNILTFFGFGLNAQDKTEKIGYNTLFMEGRMLAYPDRNIEDHQVGQWDTIKALVIERKRNYLEKGINSSPGKEQKFALPLKLKDGLPEEGFYTITSYVDHDTLFPNQLLDYQCGEITYDAENGYNHSGTDFFPWPFPWSKMYNDEVEVVAAGPGVLLVKQDGNFDQNCEENTQLSNYVAVLHEDGSSSWYFHLKKNSLTSKPSGEQVETGEYLGVVGSSGSSVAPHLHFEVYDSDINLIDPFVGPCNNNISTSWWDNQLPYKEAGINKMCTNAHLPLFPDCPEEEVSNEASVFAPGDTIFLMSYFKNISLNDTVEVSVFFPDGSLFSSWLWISPWEFYPASWLYFYIIVEENIYGEWDYQLNYKDVTYQYNFLLKEPEGIETTRNTKSLMLFPNPCNGKVNINSNLPPGKKVQVSINNQYGQELMNFEEIITSDKPTQINLSRFNPGIYIIKLTSGNQFQVAKILKR